MQRKVKPSARLASRPSSRISKREAQESRISQRSSRRGASSLRMKSTNNTLIVGVVGGFALILIIAIACMSQGPRRVQAGPVAEGNNQPASFYVQQAQQYLSAGDNLKAADEYIKAAEAAERTGNQNEAQKWSQAAYGLRKTTPLNLGR